MCSVCMFSVIIPVAIYPTVWYSGASLRVIFTAEWSVPRLYDPRVQDGCTAPCPYVPDVACLCWGNLSESVRKLDTHILRSMYHKSNFVYT